MFHFNNLLKAFIFYLIDKSGMYGSSRKVVFLYVDIEILWVICYTLSHYLSYSLMELSYSH